MNEVDEKIKAVEQADKDLAWKVYRYFRAHPALRNKKANKKVYQMAEYALMNYYAYPFHISEQEAKELLKKAAAAHNKYEPIDFVPSEKELQHFANYEEFEIEEIVYPLWEKELKGKI